MNSDRHAPDPPPTGRVVLAFQAHPDDAEMRCAGTLIRLAEAGWEVHIATATAGEGGTMTETPQRISAIRTEEARRAASLIGATYHCLGEPDGMVVYDKPTLRKTIDLFRIIAPSLVLTHPLSDYHMDHEMTAKLARAGSFVYGAPNLSSHPRRERSRVPWMYYCDPSGGTDPLGRPVEPTTLIDVGDQLDQRVEMLACHASQREWLRAHHGVDEYVDSMKRHAAWRGRQARADAAEAFVQHLGVPYPQNDLLAEMFP